MAIPLLYTRWEEWQFPLHKFTFLGHLQSFIIIHNSIHFEYKK